ncbi:hypothetical protein ACIOWK_32345 [Pseudomonas protegens]|uniref:hypothetical protein n=1 Tax=Pseudomonas protegens TaxID=380021 RepID=UPI00382CE466
MQLALQANKPTRWERLRILVKSYIDRLKTGVHLRIANAIQDEFDLDPIDDDVVEGWRTVGDISRYVLKNPQ